MTSVERVEGKALEAVQVVVRCRPMNVKEQLQGCTHVVKVCSPCMIEIYHPKQNEIDHCKRFTFDAVFDWQCDQQELYNEMVRPTVDAVLNGFNSTVFAYGQSNAGKTFTIEGDETIESSKGIIPRAFEQIFHHMSESFNMQYLLRASYLEIYQDEIRDLLSEKKNVKHEIRESNSCGVYVTDISSFVCRSQKQLNKIITTGRLNRTVGMTNINERSSRSHAIVIITIEMKELEGPLQDRVRVGKLNIVDLAGSERQNKTNADGTRLKEASKINLSLSALGNVISALVDGKGQYVPYRDSKLTRLLKDSFGGNSKTLMIANVSPASDNYEESLNTLRFASRARHIKNKPHINEDPVDALFRKYQDEISSLKAQLAARIKSPVLISGRHSKSAIKLRLSNTVANTTNPPNKSYSESNLISNRNSFEDKDNINKLVKQIELMEGKLITTSCSFLELTNQQKRVLDIKTNELKECKQRESEIKELLVVQEETMEEFRESYHNLHQEVNIKFSKLEKVYHNLSIIREKIRDAKEEFSRDRRDLDDTGSELFKDIKLRLTIVDTFIPSEARRKLLSRMWFDEEMDTWLVQEPEYTQILPRPKCVDYMRTPVTLYTAIVQKRFNHIFRCNRNKENRNRTYRFKSEDILELELVSFPRTTCHFNRRNICTDQSKSQCFNKKEGIVDIDVMNPLLRGIKVMTYPKISLNFNYSQMPITKSVMKFEIYPKPRGLVCK